MAAFCFVDLSDLAARAMRQVHELLANRLDAVCAVGEFDARFRIKTVQIAAFRVNAADLPVDARTSCDIVRIQLDRVGMIAVHMRDDFGFGIEQGFIGQIVQSDSIAGQRLNLAKATDKMHRFDVDAI